MEVIYLLIPVSIVLVALIIGAFLWSSRHGQFDDLERHGSDVLFDDSDSGVKHDHQTRHQ